MPPAPGSHSAQGRVHGSADPEVAVAPKSTGGASTESLASGGMSSRRSGPSLMFVILRLPTVILSRYGSASEHVCRRPAPYCGFRVHAALIARHPELRRGRQDDGVAVVQRLR